MFIDIHLHTVPRHGLPRSADGDNYATPADLIAIMDRTGVDRGVLLPGVSPDCRKQYSPTEAILDVCAESPERFIPTASSPSATSTPGPSRTRRTRTSPASSSTTGTAAAGAWGR